MKEITRVELRPAARADTIQTRTESVTPQTHDPGPVATSFPPAPAEKPSSLLRSIAMFSRITAFVAKAAISLLGNWNAPKVASVAVATATFIPQLIGKKLPEGFDTAIYQVTIAVFLFFSKHPADVDHDGVPDDQDPDFADHPLL